MPKSSIVRLTPSSRRRRIATSAPSLALDDARLGHLDHKPARIDAVALERLGERLDEPLVGKLCGGDVEPDAQPGRASGGPASSACCRTSRPSSIVNPALFGSGQEVGGRQAGHAPGAASGPGPRSPRSRRPTAARPAGSEQGSRSARSRPRGRDRAAAGREASRGAPPRKACTRALDRFTLYIAMSALRMRSSPVVVPAAPTAMPTLTWQATSPPSRTYVPSIAASMRRATPTAVSTSASRTSTANSSPPSRAARS